MWRCDLDEGVRIASHQCDSFAGTALKLRRRKKERQKDEPRSARAGDKSLDWTVTVLLIRRDTSSARRHQKRQCALSAICTSVLMHAAVRRSAECVERFLKE